MCSEINSFDATLTFVHSAEKKFGLLWASLTGNHHGRHVGLSVAKRNKYGSKIIRT